MDQIYAELAAVHPLLPYVAIACAVGCVVWAWRRWLPQTFEKLPRAIQGVPALLLSAVLAAGSAGEAKTAMLEALFGALAGLFAIGGHEVLKRLPGPYVGGRYPAAGEAKDD